MLHVAPDDCGGYAGAGIDIYADFREPDGLGAVALACNRVIKNNVGIVSDNPGVVNINAFEMTDTRQVTGVIYENAIGFNDFRDAACQIALSPLELGEANSISRNLGENRGHGLHPGVFGPAR